MSSVFYKNEIYNPENIDFINILAEIYKFTPPCNFRVIFKPLATSGFRPIFLRNLQFYRKIELCL